MRTAFGSIISVDFRYHRYDNERYGYQCGETANQPLVWTQNWPLRIQHKSALHIEWKKVAEETFR